MRVVLDVGQYVSAAIYSRGYPGQLLAAWENHHFDLLLSPPILTDLYRVLHYPHVRKRHTWDDVRIDQFFVTLSNDSIFTQDTLELDVVKDDPIDNKIIACAVEGGADYIVSGYDK